MNLHAVASIRQVEGVELDLGTLQVLPGMINAHDHLEFALFPRLGSGPYRNATEWARDIYRPDQDPVAKHLRVPKALRLQWGGLRNLLAGVTTVHHHNPFHASFDDGFPVRVVRDYGWAHSFAFEKDVAECVGRTPPGAPFLIHLGEGTDADATQEIFQLERMGALNERTVLIHCVGLDDAGWQRVWESGAAVVWCPRSNQFSLGQTFSLDRVPEGVPVALGTDSPLTAPGDLLDEIEEAGTLSGLRHAELRDMVTVVPRAMLRIPEYAEDWIAARAFGAPPGLVVIGGKLALIAPDLAEQLPARLRGEFFPIQTGSRPRVLVRWNVARLLEETLRFLEAPVLLGGREVRCD